jgi:hypothetical protein
VDIQDIEHIIELIAKALAKLEALLALCAGKDDKPDPE